MFQVIGIRYGLAGTFATREEADQECFNRNCSSDSDTFTVKEVSPSDNA